MWQLVGGNLSLCVRRGGIPERLIRGISGELACYLLVSILDRDRVVGGLFRLCHESSAHFLFFYILDCMKVKGICSMNQTYVLYESRKRVQLT